MFQEAKTRKRGGWLPLYCGAVYQPVLACDNETIYDTKENIMKNIMGILSFKGHSSRWQIYIIHTWRDADAHM